MPDTVSGTDRNGPLPCAFQPNNFRRSILNLASLAYGLLGNRLINSMKIFRPVPWTFDPLHVGQLHVMTQALQEVRIRHIFTAWVHLQEGVDVGQSIFEGLPFIISICRHDLGGCGPIGIGVLAITSSKATADFLFSPFSRSLSARA